MLLLLGAHGLETPRHGPTVSLPESVLFLNKHEQFGIAAGGTCGCFLVVGGVLCLLALGVVVGWQQEKVLVVTTVSVSGDVLAWVWCGDPKPGSTPGCGPCRSCAALHRIPPDRRGPCISCSR